MSREFLAEFIKMYESEPSLWKVNSKEYRDREKKEAGYARLLEKMKEIERNPTKDSVIKKINNLRSAFRKEKKKIKESLMSADDSVYKPKLWYYSLLSFLRDQETPRPSRSTKQEITDYEDASDQELCNIPSNLEGHSSYQTSSSASADCPWVWTHKRPASSIEEQEEPNVLPKASKVGDDSFDRYGKHISDRLREIEPRQIKFVQKLISDVLFEGEMESLNRNWKLVDGGQKGGQFLQDTDTL